MIQHTNTHLDSSSSGKERFVANHRHLLVNMNLHNPPRTKEVVADWLRRVVSAVRMEILDGPHVCQCTDLGNEGVTGVIVLSTSHSSIHVWDEADPPHARFDLYSCREFSFEDIEPLIAEFDPSCVEYLWVDRNDPRMTVESRGVHFYGEK